jgi:H+/Cl- antiporter ClcA
MKKVIFFLLLVVAGGFQELAAQCAMCRSTLENNFSNGNAGIAAGINTGILYLLVMPYLAAMILGYLWYKTSKDARKKLSDSVTTG